ncbi:MAG: cobalamin B12-binding domain-containing protein [Candidatus Omnitrophica bacterium]|nr:cobalamin-dependent protein [Candidatus Omnitrophota bacterium]MCB9721501.1 cobalamin B12-binding domain-containing protein [Candidatus Omnitrophota bacterium]
MPPNRNILLINTCILTIQEYTANRCYPVGLLSLASYLRREGHTAIDLLDFNIPGKYRELESVLRQTQPDVVGLTGLTIDRECIRQTAERVKRWNPDCLVVCGGPYASASWRSVVADPNIDLVVIGEGEETFREILDRRFDGESLDGIAGTAVAGDDGLVTQGPPRLPIMDLDSLPAPAYDLVDLKYYARTESMAPIGCRPYIAIFSSRACPYRCTYCHDIFGKTFRAMSAERMVELIEHYIAEYGIRDFEFIDDIWNLDRKRVIRFCELVIARKLAISFHFPNGIRMDIMDEHIITLLKQAGCVFMCIAVESADKGIQKQIKKNNKLEKIKENIAIADRVGLLTMGFFMIGFRGETFSQMLKTFRYMVTSRLNLAVMHTVTPFEGTELYEEDRGSTSGPEQDFDMDTYHRSYTGLSPVPDWQIALGKQICYILFYAHPIRAIKLIRRYPNKAYLPRKAWQCVKRTIHLLRPKRGRTLAQFQTPESRASQAKLSSLSQ